MSTEFQWGLEQCPPPIITILTGGSLAAGSGSFYLQGWNAAGVNLAGVATISWPANSRLQVSVPASARTLATHFDYYSLCFAPDNNPENGFLVGLWKSYEINGTIERILNPIVFSLPAHLLINETIALSSEFPALPVAGTTRLFQNAPGGIAHYMAYPWGDKSVDGVKVLPSGVAGWVWVRIGAPNLSAFPLGGIIGLYGCARKITDVDETARLDSVLFAPPQYEANLTSNRPFIFLQYTNRYGSAIRKGTRLTLQPFINGILEDALFSNYLICQVIGYSDNTGNLDTDSGLNDGASMYGIGDDLPYSYGQGFWVLQKDLPVNSAVVVRVSPRFDLAQLGSRVMPGSKLSILLQVLPVAGRLSLESKIFDTPQGGLIFKGRENSRALPGPPNTIAVGASAGALVKRYISDERERYEIYNFVAGVNQKISITKDGIPVNRGLDTIPDVEALLAIVGFGVGFSPVTWSPITLLTPGGISIVATYPRLNNEWEVRSNYPFIGGMSCPGGPLFARIYIHQPDDAIIQLPTKYSVLPNATQTFTVNSLAGGVQLTPPIDSFGLFNPPTLALSINSNGSLPTGEYQVGIAWEYDGTIVTAIDHNPNNNCVPVMTLNLAELGESVINISSPSKIIQKILAFGG
jgi:hypothetical protein